MRAHKLVPVQQDDWPYQAFSLDDMGVAHADRRCAWFSFCRILAAPVAAAVLHLAHYVLHDVAAYLVPKWVPPEAAVTRGLGAGCITQQFVLLPVQRICWLGK